jgi:AcrR family transcriptional regulator
MGEPEVADGPSATALTPGRLRSPRQLVIRAAAVELFYERGYHGTSLKDVASAVGMRAPSIYNHFESKQQLLQVIMLDDIDLMLREYDEAVASTDDTLGKVRRGTEAHVLHHTRYARESKVHLTELAALDEPVHTHLKDLRRSYGARWEALITQAVEEGVATTSNPALASRAVLDLGIGLARWFRSEGTLTDQTMAMYYGDYALRLIGAKNV